jgi:N-acetylmuramoyl-L-alanine amidase
MPRIRPARRAASALAALAALALTASAAYTVQPGDTLSGIATRHGTTVAALAGANDIADPDHIRAGTTLVLPGTQPAAPAPAAAATVDVLIEEISREHGWNPAIVKAVAWQESGWNNAVVSHAGAVGIMQVLPETGAHVSRRYGRSLDLHDPADNIRAGVLFLDELYQLTGGDVELSLAGYFQGLANIRRNGLYNATERYIDNVLALRERYR